MLRFLARKFRKHVRFLLVDIGQSQVRFVLFYAVFIQFSAVFILLYAVFILFSAVHSLAFKMSN